MRAAESRRRPCVFCENLEPLPLTKLNDNTPSGLRQLHDCINLKEIRFGAFSFSVSFLKISCPYLVTSYLKFEMFFTIFSNSKVQ